MNVFELIKSEVDFLEAAEAYLGPLKKVGDDTYTTEEDECPVHGGHGCFRIKYDGEEGFAKCFGDCDYDGWPADIIDLVKVVKKHDSSMAAVLDIARKFDVKLPDQGSRAKITLFASQYYSRILELNITEYEVLGGMTPLDYQTKFKGHDIDTLKTMKVGWSDGRLWESLLREGFTREEILESGLVSGTKNDGLRDYFPKNVFMYAHTWSGQISRFTMKNPDKESKHFQQKKDTWLNDIQFYMVGSGSKTAIVEGENDMASFLDQGWDGRILCTNGNLSREQIKWLIANNYDYHTYFDNDDAGRKYETDMWKQYHHGNFPSLTQYRIPNEDIKDPDDFLTSGNGISDFEKVRPPEREDVIEETIQERPQVTDVGGFYQIPRIDKEGDVQLKPISDFLIRLLYIKVQNDERSRVIKIRRRDGRWSEPVIVNSEAKVSLRHFKILVANAVDASFVGSEQDLASMWEFIYANQNSAVVNVPDHVGSVEGERGWLFQNQYIGPNGNIDADDDNIMWFDQAKSGGIAPKSLLSSLGSRTATGDIPAVMEAPDIEERVAQSFSSVLKSNGAALMIMGWLKSCAFSMRLYYEGKQKFFPFLLLWGRHGKGKSTIANWMLSTFDMADKGTTTVGQLRSGVGIERRLAYYRGLPYCIDELRADRQAAEYSKTWRGWYNRSTRVKGTRTNENIVQVPLNACLFFCGQDTFTDTAMRTRCIPVKMPQNAGDKDAYMWMEDNIEDLPGLGYQWVNESIHADLDEVLEGINEVKTKLQEAVQGNVSSRSIANYAMIGYFAMGMVEKYLPKFDFIKFMANEIEIEQVETEEMDMVNSFWEIVSGLQVGESPAIHGDHVMVKDGKLHIWYKEAFRICSNNLRGDNKEGFSAGAVRDALMEEASFIEPKPVRMGVNGVQRRALVFDIEKGSEELKAVAEMAGANY